MSLRLRNTPKFDDPKAALAAFLNHLYVVVHWPADTIPQLILI